jgi:hypothetical protein
LSRLVGAAGSAADATFVADAKSKTPGKNIEATLENSWDAHEDI